MKKQKKSNEISEQFQKVIAENKEDLIEILDGTSFAKFIAKKDKDKYDKYKEGKFKSDKESDYQDIYILTLLEGLGLPMDQLGTYLYKELIMEVREQLSKIEEDSTIESYKSLYDDINNFDSNIYYWVSRDYLEMGRMSYLNYLKQAFEGIDKSKVDPTISNSLFAGEEQPDFAYQTVKLGEQALIFESYTKESAKVLTYMK